MLRRSASLALTLCVVANAALGSCSHSGSQEQEDALARALLDRQIDAFVPGFLAAAPALAVQRAQSLSHVPSLRAVIEGGEFGFEDDPMYRELITLLYAERSYEPIFIADTHLTADGEAVYEAIASVERHGLDPTVYRIPEMELRRDTLEGAGDLAALRARVQFTPDDEMRLREWLRRHVAVDGTLPAQASVIEAITGSDPTNPLPDFSGAFAELGSAMSRLAASGPELELLLARGWLRYAAVQHYSNFNWIPPALAEERGWDLEDVAQREAILRTLLTDAFRASALARDFPASTAALPPPFEQYRSLLRGLHEYRQFVAAGGWGTVNADPERERTLGSSGPFVVELRARLRAEGYFDGDLESDDFDRPLCDALKAYERTHQMRENCTLDEEALLSLNVPATRRLAQILVSLQRWRETRLARNAGGEYIYVNVPDFYAELWDHESLVYRWRVITGRRRVLERSDGSTHVAGVTPLFSDTMLYIVFNPYWNVPPEIQRDEYDPRLVENPNWYAENGFEVMTDENGRTSIRQLPGPDNALGIVKFLFPNPFDVYMHDTPTRRLFEHPVRAFSHGCVRVHNPLDLAELLLMRDRGWTERRTERFMEEQIATGIEQWVTLTRPIPIHIEYINVRSDEDGRMNFLSDIYRYDRPLVDAVQAELEGRDAEVESGAETSTTTPPGSFTATP